MYIHVSYSEESCLGARVWDLRHLHILLYASDRLRCPGEAGTEFLVKVIKLFQPSGLFSWGTTKVLSLPDSHHAVADERANGVYARDSSEKASPRHDGLRLQTC